MRHEPSDQLPLVEKLMKRKEELEQAGKRLPVTPARQSAENANQREDSATNRRAAMPV